MTKKKTLAIFIPVAAVIAALIIGCNIALAVFSTTFDLMFGERVSYEENAPDPETTRQAARDLTEEIQGEGTVLLRNETRDGSTALPLAAEEGAAPRVVVMGYDAVDPYFGGTGSGSGGSTGIVSFLDGLTNAGIEYEQSMISAIRDAEYVAQDNARGTITSRAWRSDFTVGEMKPDDYRAALTDEVRAYSDTAVVVIGRSGGEGYDLADEMYDIGEGHEYGVRHFGPESERGKHYLELSTYESEMLRLARDNFDKVVVVVNANNPMELGFLEAEDIDAAIWTGGPGSTGWNAVARLLKGEINPSGRLASTYVYDHTLNPTYYNSNPSYKNVLNLDGANWNTVMGYTADRSHSYTNDIALFNNDNAPVFGTASTQVSKFVTYQEGIYVGYRYWETKYTDEAEYAEVVQYPFGYGLSYSSFTWSDVEWTTSNAAGGEITVTLTVTNNGPYAGKDVVQLYYSAPYTEGGIEKSAIVLGAYAKTDLIMPNASDEVTLTLAVDDMASYDYAGEGAYVLERGDYALSLRTDVHTVKADTANATTTVTVNEDVVYDGGNGAPTHAGDIVAATNRFEDSMRDMEYNDMPVLTRAGGEMPQPEGPGETFDASPETIAELDTTATFGSSYAVDEDIRAHYADEPVTLDTPYPISEFIADNPDVGYYIDEDGFLAAEEGSGLETPTKPSDINIGWRGERYRATDNTPFEVMAVIEDKYDGTWDKFLSQMSMEDMVTLIMQGGYMIERIESIYKPRFIDADGPSGLTKPMSFSSGAAWVTNTYCVEAVVGCTWNDALAERYGETIGREAQAVGANGWYAPGVNIQRNPFQGRTFEYFSEDPLISGNMGAAMVRGARSEGLYAYVKHFAVNEQETYRDGLNTWLSEQALREVYLRPFEIAVKKGGALGIMSSFNRIGSTWAGASYELLTEVLRNEWGFSGAVVTDYYRSAYMSMRHGVFAGNDLALQGMVGNDPAPHVTVARLEADNRMQQAAYNSCRNILYMTSRVPLLDFALAVPVWRVLWIVGNVVLGLLLVGCLVMIALPFIRERRGKRA